MADTKEDKGFQLSRRHMLLGSGVAALGLGAASLAGCSTDGNDATGDNGENIAYPFRGEHQPGVITPQQQQMHTAAFDVMDNMERQDIIKLLKDWSLAAERMMAGELVNDMKAFRDVPPDDTGETMDLGPGSLTITFGFGETFFKKDGKDRFGIADRMPQSMKGGIPKMAAEFFEDGKSYGDIIIQSCAEDPMIAMHAIHNLTRIGFGTVKVKWSQLGYGRTSSTSKNQSTPRNLFGFKDGTASLKAEDGDKLLNEHVWIQPEDDGGKYFAGGTFLCFRKIYQMMEVWDDLVLSEQETIIGRDKIEGAPLSGKKEMDTPDFKKKGEDGELLIAPDSHLAKVHPDNNGGAHMLRRGYNYMEGSNEYGRLNGGLFFIAFVRDPKRNFINILKRMYNDQMTEYLQHLATGLYVCPPGVKEGEQYIGQKLFEA